MVMRGWRNNSSRWGLVAEKGKPRVKSYFWSILPPPSSSKWRAGLFSTQSDRWGRWGETGGTSQSPLPYLLPSSGSAALVLPGALHCPVLSYYYYTILRATVISNVYTTESSEQWHTVKHQSSVRTDLGQSYLCSEFSFIWNKTSRRLSRHPESQHGQQWVFMSCLLFLKPRYSQTPRRGGGWLGSLIWFSG